MTSEHAELTEDLAYLARVADELELPHAVPTDATGLLGRQPELRAAAETWRELADSVERAAADATSRLGTIDSAWQGAGADAFLEHVRQIGLAGNDVTDCMRAAAEALERTAESLRVQGRDLRELVADAVDEVREAMPEKPGRAREHLRGLAEPAREILDAIAESYRDFGRCCDALAGTTPSTTEPMSAAEGTAEDSAATSTGDLAGATGLGVAGGMMLPAGVLRGMLGRQDRRARERTNRSPIKLSAEELFGAPPDAAPAVLGDEPRKKDS